MLSTEKEEFAEEAMERVLYCMETPFQKKLRVDLNVAAKTEKTWYRAKQENRKKEKSRDAHLIMKE